MRLADETNRTGLRSFFAQFFDESNPGTFHQPVERAVEHGVAMKVDFSAVRGFYEPVILTGKEPCHAAFVRGVMHLDLSPHLAGGILDLSLRCGKRVADGNKWMRILRHVVMGSRYDDVLVLRHCDPKVDLEDVAMPVSGLRSVDYDLAACDPPAELLKPLQLSSHFGRDLR